jgi:S1-C subfamily serine protease
MNDDTNSENSQYQPQQGYFTGSRVTSPLPGLHNQETTAVNSQPANGGKKRKNRGFFPGLLLALMLMFGMLVGGAGAGAVMLLGGHSVAPVTANPPVASSNPGQQVAQIAPNTIANIYKQVSPSVVMVDSIIRSTSGGRFGGGQSGEATGTGIVIDNQGHILTNNHVINGATSVKIELTDGSQYTAKVVGAAPQDDLAVLEADVPAGKLTPATLGDSSTVETGDAVIAVGYPFGLEQSVTSGIVSGLDRQESGESGRALSGLIQTDAAINPGNSGGPLLNADGEVIGINTMIESPVQAFTGIGLAIPINHAKDLIPQLEQGGQVQRPWLGISGSEITASMQQQLNLPVSAGVLVMDVTAGGPAEQAGIQPSTAAQDGSSLDQLGDIIVSIDGHSVGAVSDLSDYLNSKQAGDKVTLGIVRDGQQQDVSVTLQAWPANLGNSQP